jgi:uncharacterized protein (DUF1330 family)
MAKAYWVVCYRSISDPAAREEYTKLAVPAVLAGGGRYLARGSPIKTYEGGISQRTVLVGRFHGSNHMPTKIGSLRCSCGMPG